MKPKVSIIITTRNRAAHLGQTLASFQGLVVPKDVPTELLVVDNGSTDRTAEVVKAVSLSQIPIRYLHEARLGQANARNSGMANTTGEIILFTDDDVRVRGNWIEGMTHPIFQGKADALAGGVVIAQHLMRPWMTAYHCGWLAAAAHATDMPVEEMTGANMSFSRAVLRRVGGFDENTGPGQLGYGDDTLFSLRIRAAGFRILGMAKVFVEHHFDAGRLRRESWIKAAAARGRSRAYLSYHWHGRSVEHPALKEFRARLRLLMWSWTNPQPPADAEGCSAEELKLVKSCHHWACLRKLNGQPRKYRLDLARS